METHGMILLADGITVSPLSLRRFGVRTNLKPDINILFPLGLVVWISAL